MPLKTAGALSAKYGVIFPGGDFATLEWTMQTLKADWYLAFTSGVSTVSNGVQAPIYVYVAPGQPRLSTTKLQDLATQSPGAVWYVGGEPNIRFTVDELIEDLRYYYTEIKIADSTARITSPSPLNWEFTCIGCVGFTSGKEWMTNLVSRYQDLYGTLPPWDLWAIDVYPIDWWNIPNTGFEPETIAQYSPDRPPNSELIAAKQIQAYREYIDTLPGKSGQPIIVTELGMHVAWSNLEFSPECGAGSPSGEFRPLAVIDYFESIYTWLENHSSSHNIERWFTYVTYSEFGACLPDGYAGMSLMASPGVGGQLTDIGEWYVARSSP